MHNMFKLKSLTFSWRMRITYFVSLALMIIMLWKRDFWTLANSHATAFVFVIVLIIQFLVTFKTLILTQHQMTRLRSVSGNWDLLILTNITPRRLGWDIFSGILRQTWVDYVLLALFRSGIALVISQIFFFQFGWQNGPFFAHPTFQYILYNPYNVPSRSDPIQILVGIAMLIVLALLECSLTITISMVWSQMRRSEHAVAFAVATRIILSLLALGSFTSLNTMRTYDDAYYPAYVRMRLHICFVDHTPHDYASAYRSRYNVIEHLNLLGGACDQEIRDVYALRIRETTQTGLTVFIDQGTLLTANIFRPSIPLKLITNQWNITDEDIIARLRVRHLPFVVRNIFTGALISIIYGITIVVLMHYTGYILWTKRYS